MSATVASTLLLPFLSSCVQFWGYNNNCAEIAERPRETTRSSSWSFSLSWSWTRLQHSKTEKWKWILRNNEKLLKTMRMPKDSEKPPSVVWPKINWIIAVLISGLPSDSLLSLSFLCSSCAVFMDSNPQILMDMGKGKNLVNSAHPKNWQIHFLWRECYPSFHL